jgi:hypothetical protein
MCAFLVMVLIRKGLAQAGLWAAPLGALAGIVAAAAAIWAVAPRPVKVPLPPELQVPDWVIGRPAELTAVVKALTGGRARTVGITTGLYGAGGFGKTILAQMVCADRRVRRRFRGRVYLVTVGRDVRGAETIAARVNDVIKLVTGEDATFTNPEDAGRRLGSLLDAGPRRLLALDDVWSQEQLAPQVCKRLDQLALISQAADQAGGIAVHDVVRDFLRAEVGEQRLARLTGMLLDTVAADLPEASPLDKGAGCPVRTAWWELGHEDRYLWDHLIEHLAGTGRFDEADAVASDLRWVGARLERFGPAASAADLSAAGTPRAARLQAVLARAAHLLAPHRAGRGSDRCLAQPDR